MIWLIWSIWHKIKPFPLSNNSKISYFACQDIWFTSIIVRNRKLKNIHEQDTETLRTNHISCSYLIIIYLMHLVIVSHHGHLHPCPSIILHLPVWATLINNNINFAPGFGSKASWDSVTGTIPALPGWPLPPAGPIRAIHKIAHSKVPF